MKFSIAQIGENRLKKVLVQDKEQNPEKLKDVLKSDIQNVAVCYMDDVSTSVDVLPTDDGVTFNVTIKCKRVKSIGVLA
mgnify:CR=1 FL=1